MCGVERDQLGYLAGEVPDVEMFAVRGVWSIVGEVNAHVGNMALMGCC
jgi:hypothetical protein